MKRIFTKQIVALLTGVLLISSCATIVSKSSYPVYVRSNPLGANVTITDKKGKVVFEGTTPKEIRLKSGAGFFSKAEYQVKLSSPGFADKIVTIDYKLNAWYFGNVIFGGLLGLLIVDPATGAMWKVIDPVVDETLRKRTATEATPTLDIININDLSKELKKGLVRIN